VLIGKRFPAWHGTRYGNARAPPSAASAIRGSMNAPTSYIRLDDLKSRRDAIAHAERGDASIRQGAFVAA